MDVFKERWLLAHSPNEPADHLVVHRLNLRDGHWFTQTVGDWKDFAGSSEALSSFAQPSTEVILNTFTHTHPTGADGQGWLSVHEYPPRAMHHPVLPVHIDVLNELKAYGNILTVIACEDHAQWENSPRLVLVDKHESNVIEQWAEQQHTPALSRVQWFFLTLRLYIQAPAAHQRTRLSWACFIALTLGLYQWSLNSSFEQTENTVRTTMLQPAAQTVQPTQAEPDWATWQQQLKRFGDGERANVQHLKFMWTQGPNIYTAVELNKPRKRLPKGCQALSEESTQIACALPSPKDGKAE